MINFALAGRIFVAAAAMGTTFAAYAEPTPQAQNQGTVKVNGTVLDENGEPLIGVSVVQKGNEKNAAATDLDGKFTLRVPAGAQLHFSYVGYQSTVAAAQDGMSVSLKPASEMLNELVAVGFGTQKKANLTGAVATVDVARVMDSRPSTDVVKALQGAVPGLTITNAQGGIDSDASIRIRGVGTLSNSQTSAPLIVLDGVPTDDLNFVNPDDIADISVLKDAASSAVYGTRAAFGVILITTKSSAKKDRVSVNYSNNFGWSGATILPEFASTVDQCLYGLQAYYRSGNASQAQTEVGAQKYKDILPYAQLWAEQHNGPYTSRVELQPYVSDDNVGDYRVFEDGSWYSYADWNVGKTLFSDNAFSQKHNLSIEGAAGRTDYRISVGYDQKEGLQTVQPDKNQRYSANVTVNTAITDWLKAGARVNFSQREYQTPETSRNSYQYAWRWPGFMENYGYILVDGKEVDFRNEFMNRGQAIMGKRTTRSTRLQGWINAEIIKGLNVQADFTYDGRSKMENAAYGYWSAINTWTHTSMTYYTAPSAGQSSTDASKSAYTDDTWSANLYATYAKTFKEDHNFKAMAGISAERNRYNYFYVYRNGLLDTSLPVLGLTDGGKDGTQYGVSSSDTHRATAGVFGRVNYDYKGIYLLEVNGRYDGSSRFPHNDYWAFFPSVSAGYRFSEEAYFAPVKNVVTNGKLRASWGQIGNEAIGSNMFISTISTGKTNWLTSSNTKVLYASTPSLVQSSLTWERISTADIGIDLGFMNNQLNFSFDWYSRVTDDMLAREGELPAVLGASSPYTNAGSMRTNGWELSLGWNHLLDLHLQRKG